MWLISGEGKNTSCHILIGVGKWGMVVSPADVVNHPSSHLHIHRVNFGKTSSPVREEKCTIHFTSLPPSPPSLFPWLYLFLLFSLFYFKLFSRLIVTLHLPLIRILSLAATGCSSFIMRLNVFKVEDRHRGRDGEMDGCMAAWSGITWGSVCVCLCIFTQNWHSCLGVFSLFICVCLAVSMCLRVCSSSLPHPLCRHILSFNLVSHNVPNHSVCLFICLIHANTLDMN